MFWSVARPLSSKTTVAIADASGRMTSDGAGGGPIGSSDWAESERMSAEGSPPMSVRTV